MFFKFAEALTPPYFYWFESLILYDIGVPAYEKLPPWLDDESNETLMNFTTKTIREMTLKILKELHLSKQETINIYNKLKEYKYVDEMNELVANGFRTLIINKANGLI